MCKLPVLAIAVLLICSFSAVAHSQEEAELEYAYGTVVSISSEKVVIDDYDFSADEMAQIAYIISPEVKLDGVASLDDIVVGDSIDIYYVVEDGNRIAKTIYTEK